MKKFKFITGILTVSIFVFLFSCSDDHSEVDNHENHSESKEAHQHDAINEDNHSHSVGKDYVEDERHTHDEKKHEHEEEKTTSISQNISKEVGIKTDFVTPRVLNEQISSFGVITTGSDQLSHVRARFPGLVQSVIANIGDQVNKGDLLATVESNDSLRSYKVISPITGTIIQRHANTGEFTGDQILFSIANFETLWAEFRVYPEQGLRVKVGQKVIIRTTEHHIEANIKHLVPMVDKPYQLARVKFVNSQLALVPGMLVEGHIQVGEHEVPLAIRREAIQTIDGRQGVFIRAQDEYKFLPVGLGRYDRFFYEVLSGLEENQEYVSENSYLIKADIEKSEAEHEH